MLLNVTDFEYINHKIPPRQHYNLFINSTTHLFTRHHLPSFSSLDSRFVKLLPNIASPST